LNFEGINSNHLGQIEQLSKQLIEILKRAKLGDEPICKALEMLEEQTEIERRKRFDDADTSGESLH
jgi:hypothetical protein